MTHTQMYVQCTQMYIHTHMPLMNINLCVSTCIMRSSYVEWLHPCINMGVIQFQSHIAHIYILQVTIMCVHTNCRHIHS